VAPYIESLWHKTSSTDSTSKPVRKPAEHYSTNPRYRDLFKEVRRYNGTSWKPRIANCLPKLSGRLPDCIINECTSTCNTATVKLSRDESRLLLHNRSFSTHLSRNWSTSSPFTWNLLIKITGLALSSICTENVTFSSISTSFPTLLYTILGNNATVYAQNTII
jgi:hypothetical protein